MMIFVSSRDLKSNPAVLWKNNEVVITVNGKPKAVAIRIDGNPREILDMIERTRAQLVLEKLRIYSVEKGFDKLSEEEVEEIIEKSRCSS